MAEISDPFSWSPPKKGEEKKAAAVKTKGVEVADPFTWESPSRKKEPEKPDMLKGAVQTMGRGARVMADTAMGAIGVDLRTESGTTRKPHNFVEGMAQDVAKSSREEVNEQRKVGIGKAMGARAIGAATGLPRFNEDAKNAVKGSIYGVAEGLREVTGGRNVVDELRGAAKQADSRGNPLAPALGALLDAYNLSEPSHNIEALTGEIGKATGAPATVESGQGDVLNAVPMGAAGHTVGQGVRAAAKAGLKAGGIMGAQTGIQVAGRETAASGKTFNAKNVAEQTAKSFAVGTALGAGLHATTNGFNRTPKNIGKNPEAHARDTVVSTKPIEPQPKGREAKAFQKAVDASAELKAREAELAALPDGGVTKSIPRTIPKPVPDSVQAALDRSYKLNGDPVSEVKAGKATDRALEAGGEVQAREKQLARMEKPRIGMARDVAAEGLSEIPKPRVSMTRDVAKTGLESPGENLPHPDEVKPQFDENVKKNADTETLEPQAKEPLDSSKNVKPLVEQMTGGKTAEELKTVIGDRKTQTPEQRRQAKLELKQIEKGEKKDAGTFLARHKNIDADKPPAAPEAPLPKEDDVITRAEFKRRTVKEQRPATPEEATRYKAVAEAEAERDYHQARYKAGLKQLAAEVEQPLPMVTKRGSNEKALSPESGEINKAIAEKISKMRELAGHSDEPTIDVYDKTFMGEHKIEPLTGKTPQERLAELEGAEREADRWAKEAKAQAQFIKGEWKSKADSPYKVEDKTYIPVQVTAGDGTKHHYNIVTKAGGKKVMTVKEAEAHALKQAQGEYGSVAEGSHPRAINVPTKRGDVLLESYKRKPAFDARELSRATEKAGGTPEFDRAKADFLELKPRRDKAGEYVGVDYEKLHGFLKKFITEESGSANPMAYMEGATHVGKEVADIWATHVLNKNKTGLDKFLKDREVVRDIIGASDKTKMERLGDVIKTALGHKNDMDWVRGYSPELAEGLDAIRYRMDRAGQGVERLSDAVRAREEFADAIDMTPQAVRDRKWEHITQKQADFIADISELRAEASDMISDIWDDWHDQGMPHHIEKRHLEGLYKQYTGGVDIKTGLREQRRGLDKALDHLQTGAYDAMVTGNMRIHTLHIVDALTMASSVVHPENMGKAFVQFITSEEVRNFLQSYQGAGVYKQTRGSKLTWWEKNIGKAIELSAESVLGKKGLEKVKLLEGGVLERHKIDIVRGAAIMRAGEEMGYKGNILQDVAREYATGKNILTPTQHTELSIRVLNDLEDAFGYNPAGFVNRNAFRQIGADRLFPFMGIRSVQNRLFSKFVSERNLKALFTLAITTQAFAGSSAVLLPVEKALQFAAPESYIQMKHLLDMVSVAGAIEVGLKKTGVMNEDNEQWIAPFLRKIEHIQPEVVPWMFNEPSLVMNIFSGFSEGWTTAKALTLLSATMGGSALAGVTTPNQIESFWRLMGKAADGKVTEDEKGKQIGGKKMSVYDRGIMGEKRLATKQHIPTNHLRELLNHLLPKSDAVDERYANEAKFAAAAKTQLMRNGYNDKEVKSAFKQLYMPIHKQKRAVTAEEFIEFIHEHPKK